jgi:hypothetical protein
MGEGLSYYNIVIILQTIYRYYIYDRKSFFCFFAAGHTPTYREINHTLMVRSHKKKIAVYLPKQEACNGGGCDTRRTDDQGMADIKFVMYDDAHDGGKDGRTESYSDGLDLRCVQQGQLEIGWDTWMSARLFRIISQRRAGMENSPRLAAVERRDAIVISRFPLRPSSAGTRMNSSLISMKRSQCWQMRQSWGT